MKTLQSSFGLDEEPGKLAKLVEFVDGKPIFHRELLDKLCLQAGEKPVSIIATIGKFRQGKSFWSNILLNGLRNRGKTRFWDGERIGGPGNIAFKSGIAGDTKGIMVWNDVFHGIDQEGNQVAYILMDVQGTLDMGEDPRESATLAVIASLLASTMVFNVNSTVDMGDLEQLRVYFDFCKGISFEKGPHSKIGQHFVILVRDSRASTGGLDSRYLQTLRGQARGHEGNISLINSISESFGKIDSYHVPPPPSKVFRADRQIHVQDCRDEQEGFFDHLCKAADFVLKTATAKRQSGSLMNGLGLRVYMESLFKGLESNPLEIMTIKRANFEYSLAKLSKNKQKRFNRLIEEVESREGDSMIEPYLYGKRLDVCQEIVIQSYLIDPLYGHGNEIENLRGLEEFKKSIESTATLKMESYLEKYNHYQEKKRLLLMGVGLGMTMLGTAGLAVYAGPLVVQAATAISQTELAAPALNVLGTAVMTALKWKPI